MLINGGYYPAPIFPSEADGACFFDRLLAAELRSLLRHTNASYVGAVTREFDRRDGTQLRVNSAFATEGLSERSLGQTGPDGFQQIEISFFERRSVRR